MVYQKQRYCTIGEFADLCNVSKQTLQYYDRMGVFSPEAVGDNGYRYYAFQQLDAFRILMALKTIDTPLKTIKEYLNHRSQDELLALLYAQRQMFQQEIAHLQQANQIIENKVAQVKYANAVDFSELRLEYQPEERLVLSDPLVELDDQKYSQTIADHVRFCEKHRLNVGYPIGSIISQDNLLAGSLEFSYWFTKVADDYDGPYAFTKPAGWYVVGYYKGYYGTCPAIYQEKFAYLKDTGLTIAGQASQKSNEAMYMAASTDDYVTEVAIAAAGPDT